MIDIHRCYWNSRLQHERDRILVTLSPSDVLCDMFCGVGPMAVRCAKKGLNVVANDLNPACYEYLVKNVARNGLEDKVKCFNLDAAAFLNELLAETTDASEIVHFRRFTHVYMNLPGDAVEFLYVFQGMVTKASKAIWTPDTPLPTIMVNAFDDGKDELEAQDNLNKRIKRVLVDYDPETDFGSIHCIKDVSAHKSMYCVTFKLSKLVAYGKPITEKPPHPDEGKENVDTRTAQNGENEQPHKKQKTIEDA
jgi:tRNA (guanine37-N1)-methyltransferase